MQILSEYICLCAKGGKSKKAEAKAIKIFCGQEKGICQTNVDTCRHQITPKESGVWQSNYVQERKHRFLPFSQLRKAFPLFTSATCHLPETVSSSAAVPVSDFAASQSWHYWTLLDIWHGCSIVSDQSHFCRGQFSFLNDRLSPEKP